MLTLYSYFRSSASYRVRIALNLKGLAYTQVPVNLLKGEQADSAYTRLNPQGLVPSLVEDEHALTQSLAIMEYLDECHPEPPLLPLTPRERARVRALALTVACEIAPLNNSGVLAYLTGQAGVGEQAKKAWYQHWIHKGFSALEAMLSAQAGTGRFCHGDAPSLADCCLVPQVFNARRFEADLSAYPTIVRIDAACADLPAFTAAHPARQPDAA